MSLHAALINALLIQAALQRMYDDYKPSNAEWMDLLSIANTYGLKRVHRRALAEIEDIDVNIDPVEQVLLAKKLNVKKWLVPAFVTLCTRTEPIKGTEVDKLGINTFVTLVTARESISRDLFTMKLEDRALLVNDKLRCCGYSPTQLHDGDNGAKICPGCQQIVIPGPGIQPAFTNDNRRCCGYQPSRWMELGNGAWLCSGCQDIVLPQLFSSNLQCCKMPFIDSSRFSQGDNGAYLCAECEKIAIPGPGGADFDNRHLRCCYNPPSKWISQPDGSQICPSCKGITLPCSLTFQERTLALVKRVFDLED